MLPVRAILCGAALLALAQTPAPAQSANQPASPFAADPDQSLERTCFQTHDPWGASINLRSDVAIVYGIGAKLPDYIQTWRDHGYRIHVMTGVSWGKYQDYLYGRFDGANHEDEAQVSRNGQKRSHGGDVYYMCPSVSFGKYLRAGVQRALDAGAEAVHLEEPEFWVASGYSEAFKREWKDYYHEDWRPPHSSVDAQWRASKLKYYLYRRALQQVFDYIQDYNKRTGRRVRCYVATHSLLNYAQWSIVSPESSLARLAGCDGYIAQVWTGTARTPNFYRGKRKERTFETAFLEYGAMQNLVRSTGRSVWYLNDPIEDNPDHDWDYYRRNWESTLTASLLQPEVWRYEVAPWPERIFEKTYPANLPKDQRKRIPPDYALELQTVMNALHDMNQPDAGWDCGTTGIGLFVGDSLMFQRGDPAPSDRELSHIYGLALPLVKHGIPVAPVQLENTTVPGYLAGFKVLLLTYQGMKPLTPEVHAPIADWVAGGGTLVVCDDDSDPFNGVREWWNTGGENTGGEKTGGENTGAKKFRAPREDLFARMNLTPASAVVNSGKLATWRHGKGNVIWLRENPAKLARAETGADEVLALVKHAAALARLDWRETNYLLLRRGPYVIAAGLDESIPVSDGGPKILPGRYINLFDPQWRVLKNVRLEPGSRYFLLDLDASDLAAGDAIGDSGHRTPDSGGGTPDSGRRDFRNAKTAGADAAPRLLAAGCRALPQGKVDGTTTTMTIAVEGVGGTPGGVLLRACAAPVSITLDGRPVAARDFDYSPEDQLLRIRFANEARPRTLTMQF